MTPYLPLLPVALNQARRPGGEDNGRRRQPGFKANPKLVVLSCLAGIGLGLSDEYVCVDLRAVLGVIQPAGVDQLVNREERLRPVPDQTADLLTSRAGVNQRGARYKNEGLD